VFVLAVIGASVTDRGRCKDPEPQPWPHIDQTEYVGSVKCAECHKTYYDSWKDTAHNKMIRRPVAQGPDRTVLAHFSQPSSVRSFELKDVKWVIGHRWKQRFIGGGGTCKLQFSVPRDGGSATAAGAVAVVIPSSPENARHRCNYSGARVSHSECETRISCRT
jgi:hypothetical protein